MITSIYLIFLLLIIIENEIDFNSNIAQAGMSLAWFDILLCFLSKRSVCRNAMKVLSPF